MALPYNKKLNQTSSRYSVTASASADESIANDTWQSWHKTPYDNDTNDTTETLMNRRKRNHKRERYALIYRFTLCKMYFNMFRLRDYRLRFGYLSRIPPSPPILMKFDSFDAFFIRNERIWQKKV